MEQQDRKRLWVARNIERYRAYQSEYQREYQRNYQQQHYQDKRAEKKKQYYQANKHAILGKNLYNRTALVFRNILIEPV